MYTSHFSVSSPVVELTITRVSNAMFTIQWNKPSTPNGVTQHYIVSIAVDESSISSQIEYNTTATHLSINELGMYKQHLHIYSES